MIKDKHLNKSYVAARNLGPREIEVNELTGNPVVSVVIVRITGQVDANKQVINVNREVLTELGIVKKDLTAYLDISYIKDKKNIIGVEYRDLHGNKAGVYLSEPTLADGTSNIRMDDLSKVWFSAPYDLVYSDGHFPATHHNNTDEIYKELIANA